MPASLFLDITSGASSILVRATGEIDLDTMDDLERALTQLGVNPTSIQLDLRGVSFIDSSGLNMLLRMDALCRDNGGGLTVVAPSPAVVRLLEISGVNAALTIIG